MKKKLLIICACLIVGLTGLRIYGAYRNEQTGADYRAEQALQEVSVQQREADEGEAKLSRKVGGALSSADAAPVIFDKMNHDSKVVQLKYYAQMEKRYSDNRRLQTLRLVRKTWLALTGTTETPDDWFKFLEAHTTTPAER